RRRSALAGDSDVPSRLRVRRRARQSDRGSARSGRAAAARAARSRLDADSRAAGRAPRGERALRVSPARDRAAMPAGRRGGAVTARRPRRGRERLAAVVLTVAAAAASAVAYAVYSRLEWRWIVLGWVGLVPWLAALDRMRSLRAAVASGVVMSVAFTLAV